MSEIIIITDYAIIVNIHIPNMNKKSTILIVNIGHIINIRIKYIFLINLHLITLSWYIMVSCYRKYYKCLNGYINTKKLKLI